MDAALFRPTILVAAWLLAMLLSAGAAEPGSPGPTISSNVHNAPGWERSRTYVAAKAPATRVLNGAGWNESSGTYNPGQPLNAYELVSGGNCRSAPSGGPSGTGASITDGTCTWKHLSPVDYISITGWAFDNQPWQAGKAYRYRDYVTADSPLRAYALDSPDGCTATAPPTGTGQNAVVTTADGCAWHYFADVIYSSRRSYVPTMTFMSFPWSKTTRFTGATYNLKANHRAELWNDREYVAGANGELAPIRTQAHHDFTNDTDYGEADWIRCAAACFHLVITTAPGESFRDRVAQGDPLTGYDPAKGVAIRNSTLPERKAQGFLQRDNYVDLIGLQIKSSHTSAIDGLNVHGNYTTIRHCILEGGPDAATVMLDVGPSVLANSLVISHSKAGFVSKYPAVILHSTIVNPGRVPGSIGIQTTWQWNYDGTVVSNTGVFGFEHAAGHLATAAPFWSARSSHNATDAGAGASGAVTIAGQPYMADALPGAAYDVPMGSAFISPGRDWRLSKSSPLARAGRAFGAFAVNCGINVPNCPRSITYDFDSPDIVGTARPQGGGWDIGAWQTPARVK